MSNLYEISTQTYKDELLKNSSLTMNAFIGRQAFDLIVPNLGKPASTIHEYDTQVIDKSTILQLVDTHYLLLNKVFIKEFYLYWQKMFVSGSKEQSDDLKSFCLLLINPNFASAWSRRKSLIIYSSKDQALIKRELEFNKLILTKHCKCEQAYVHRRWLVKNLDSANFSPEFCSTEADLICQVLSKKVKANYYCWTYLNWLTEYAIRVCSMASMEPVIRSIAESLTVLLYVNPSDFCVFHSRLNLIGILAKHDKLELFLNRDEQKESLRFLFNELELSDDLLIRYPEYTTVWNYRKYLYMFLKSSFFDNFAENGLPMLLNELNESFLKNINSKFSTRTRINASDLAVSELNKSSWLQALVDRDFVIGSLVSDETGAKSNNQARFRDFLAKFL